jgi:hypothetical protein
MIAVKTRRTNADGTISLKVTSTLTPSSVKPTRSTPAKPDAQIGGKTPNLG